jgi:Spy/CpxP family protein refolding chaperone
MKRRTLLGVVVGAVVTLSARATVLTAAWANGPGGGPGGHGPGMPGRMMKHMLSAALDEALDQASVTPEQRTAIHASRDRVFAAMDAQRPDARAQREQVLALFEGDRLDAAQLQALHASMEQRHQAVQAAVAQAIVEIHDTLTPAQRRVVAEYARTHGPGRMH